MRGENNWGSSRRRLQLITFGLVSAAIALVMFWQLQPRLSGKASGSTNEPDAADFTAQETAVAVEAMPARIGDLVMRISATGQTRALREIVMSTKIGGTIVQLAVGEGQSVGEGDLLLKLDDREYRLALAEAQDRLLGAQVDFGMLQREEKRGGESEERKAKSVEPMPAESTAEVGEQEERNKRNVRLDELKDAENKFLEIREKYEQGQVSEDEFLRAKLKYETAQVLAGKKRDELLAHRTGLTAAELALQRAELNSSYTEIRAPFSGVVADLQVETGQQISAGQECFKLVDLSQMEVEAQVLESEIGLIEEGRKAEVTFPAYPGETFRGRAKSLRYKRAVFGRSTHGADLIHFILESK